MDVVYTRVQDKVSWPSDNEKDLLERSRIANTSKADYFISIHMNFRIQRRIPQGVRKSG